MVVAGEVLARYGDAADKSAGAGAAPAFAPVAELYLSAPGSALHEGNADPVAHTVVGGETLQSIARSTLGDSRLWYRIAQANGLSVQPDKPLQAGVTLSIPKATLSANSASTFKPYDPSRVIGDPNPALNALPVPQADDGGCGGFGQILTLIVIVAVIAITQQYELAGEGLAIVGEAEAAQAGYTTAQLAQIGASSSGASFSAGAIAGAAGSVAGQLVGNALGIQDGFSWQAVALGALSGGIGGALSGVDFTGGAIGGLGNTIVRSAVGSALTQGIAVATGLQRSFSWTNVAASAIGAGVGYGANEALGLTRDGIATNAFSGADKFGRAALGSLAASTATALAHGGRVSITQIGVNAFGQSIGSSLAEQAMMGGTQEDRLGGFMAQQDAGSMQRDMSAAQSSFRQQEITAQNQIQARSDAVYGWRNGGDGLGFKGNGSEGLRYGGVMQNSVTPRPDDTRILSDGPPDDHLDTRGLLGQPIADASITLKQQAEALRQGWNRQGWSVLQGDRPGDRPIAYDLAYTTRNFLGGITGYDATNAARSSFAQGNNVTGALQLMQAFGEAGTTAFGFSGVGSAASGLRMGGMTASELGAARATYATDIGNVGGTSALFKSSPYLQIGSTGQTIMLTDEYAASQGWLINSRGGLVTGQYLGATEAGAEKTINQLIQNGFPSKGNNLNVYQHIMGDGADSAFRGATLSPSVAAHFATSPGGYGVVLELGAVKGYDAARIVADAPRSLGSSVMSYVNTNLAMRANELEIVIRNDVSLGTVTGARLFYRDPSSLTAAPRFVRNINLSN